jgi:hypothetical protein
LRLRPLCVPHFTQTHTFCTRIVRVWYGMIRCNGARGIAAVAVSQFADVGACSASPRKFSVLDRHRPQLVACQPAWRYVFGSAGESFTGWSSGADDQESRRAPFSAHAADSGESHGMSG